MVPRQSVNEQSVLNTQQLRMNTCQGLACEALAFKVQTATRISVYITGRYRTRLCTHQQPSDLAVAAAAHITGRDRVASLIAVGAGLLNLLHHPGP